MHANHGMSPCNNSSLKCTNPILCYAKPCDAMFMHFMAGAFATSAAWIRETLCEAMLGRRTGSLEFTIPMPRYAMACDAMSMHVMA